MHNVNLPQSQLNVNVTLIAPVAHLTHGRTGVTSDVLIGWPDSDVRELNIPPGVTFYHSPVAYPRLAGN